MNNLIIISGPSGSGKTFLLKNCLNLNLNFTVVRKKTTRKPRNEEDDFEFTFNCNSDEIMECDCYYSFRNNYYGFNFKDIDEIFSNKKNAIIIVRSIAVIEQLKRKYENVYVVLCLSSDLKKAEQLLRKNHSSENEVNLRLYSEFECEIKKEYQSGVRKHIFDLILYNKYDNSFLNEFKSFIDSLYIKAEGYNNNVMNNNDEMIDILDENGVYTGKVASRYEVHKNGLWHRISLVCLVNGNSQILLQRRSNHVAKYPGLWDLSVASHIRSGENSISTAQRELVEELGLPIKSAPSIKQFKYISCFRNQYEINNIIEKQYYDLFLVTYGNISIKKLTFNDNEVMDARWANLSEIIKMKNNNLLHPRTEWIHIVEKELYK